MKSPALEIKNLIQDTLMRIPFFISPHPTSIIATEYSQSTRNYVEGHPGLITIQTRLYYQQERPYRTLIMQFDSVEAARQFKAKHHHHAHNNALLNNFTNPYTISDDHTITTPLYYCLDIAFADGMLYECGKVVVLPPYSPTLRSIIDEVSKVVMVEGASIQQELKEHLSRDPCLHFLNHNTTSSQALYYRWRVYSYLQGDGHHHYRTQPFPMVQSGAMWHPPPAAEKYKCKVLNFKQRVHFTNLLRNLTCHKKKIQEAMVFCIYHIQSAVDICAIVVVMMGQMLLHDVDEEVMLPYLYLLSDVFFNSPTSVYRDVMAVILPHLLQRLHDKATKQLNKTMSLLEVWKKKFVFQEDYLLGLQYILSPGQYSKINSNITDQLYSKPCQQIESMCYQYGIPYYYQYHDRNVSGLVYLLSNVRGEVVEVEEPPVGGYDGEELTDKDLLKIKNKGCKVVTCEGYGVKSLFERGAKYSVDRS